MKELKAKRKKMKQKGCRQTPCTRKLKQSFALKKTASSPEVDSCSCVAFWENNYMTRRKADWIDVWNVQHVFLHLLTETNRFGLGTLLLLCLVIDLQKPTSVAMERKVLSRAFYLQKSLCGFRAQACQFSGKVVCPSPLQLQGNIHSHISTISTVYM